MAQTVSELIALRRDVAPVLAGLEADGLARRCPMKAAEGMYQVYLLHPAGVPEAAKRRLFEDSGLPLFLEALEYDAAAALSAEERGNLYTHFFHGDDLLLVLAGGDLLGHSLYEDMFTAVGEHFTYAHAAVSHPRLQGKGAQRTATAMYMLGKQLKHFACNTQQAVLGMSMAKAGTLYPLDAPPGSDGTVRRVVDAIGAAQPGQTLDKDRMVFLKKYSGVQSDVTKVVKDPKTPFSEKFFGLFDRAAGDCMVLVAKVEHSNAKFHAALLMWGAESLRALRQWTGSIPGVAARPILTTAAAVRNVAWVPDAAARHCTRPACARPFTLTRRRHHCRSCGGLFCAACTPFRAAVDRGAAVRVCEACARRLVADAAAPPAAEPCRVEDASEGDAGSSAASTARADTAA